MPIVVRNEAPGAALGAAANVGQYRAGEDAWRRGMAEQQFALQQQEFAANQQQAWQRMALAQQEQAFREQQAAQAQVNWDAQQSDQHAQDFQRRMAEIDQWEAQQKANLQRNNLAAIEMQQRNDQFNATLAAREAESVAGREHELTMLDARNEAAAKLMADRYGNQIELQDRRQAGQAAMQDDRQAFRAGESALDRALRERGLDITQMGVTQRQADAKAGRQLQQGNREWNQARSALDAEVTQLEKQLQVAQQLAVSTVVLPAVRNEAVAAIPTLQQAMVDAHKRRLAFLQRVPGLPMVGEQPSRAPAPTTMPAVPPQVAGGGVAVVQTPEQAMALPSGTRFMTPDGRIKVRP